jgi:hypothetical protein
VSIYVSDPRAAISTDRGEVVMVDQVRIGGRPIEFPRPIPGAPEYAVVVAAEATADELRPRLLEGLDLRGEVPWQPNTRLVLDMRGAAGTAVTGAITGLEAFANHHILRTAASGTFVLGDREMTTEQAFAVPVNERYSEVLPVLLAKSRPTGERWWPIFRRIQALAVLQRHALHEPQRRKGLDRERSLAERIYNGEYRGAAALMVAAFEHFSPGWLSEERRQGLADTDSKGFE